MVFQKVGVLGSGIMGSGIAEVAAATGATVIVRSRSQATADAMLTTMEKSLAKQVEKGKRDQGEADAIRSRVTATTHLSDLADCDFVIESVIEDLAVKRALFNELGGVINPEAVLATNTSTLSVIELAMETSRPDRVCGLHFFNPASVMSLVEVVRPICASDETMAAVTEFVLACGKEPVNVKDQAGFVVNAPPLPVPQQRGTAPRAGRRDQGGHRHRHEGRVRLPHGTLRTLGPRRTRHIGSDPRRPLRGVRRAELLTTTAATPHGQRRTTGS